MPPQAVASCLFNIVDDVFVLPLFSFVVSFLVLPYSIAWQYQSNSVSILTAWADALSSPTILCSSLKQVVPWWHHPPYLLCPFFFPVNFPHSFLALLASSCPALSFTGAVAAAVVTFHLSMHFPKGGKPNASPVNARLLLKQVVDTFVFPTSSSRWCCPWMFQRTKRMHCVPVWWLPSLTYRFLPLRRIHLDFPSVQWVTVLTAE